MQTSKNHTNFGRLYLGSIFIALGFIYLVKELGIYSFDSGMNLLDFLPILLVAFGLSLLDLKMTSSIALGALLTLFLSVISIMFLLNSSSNRSNGFMWNDSDRGYFMMNRFFDNSMPCRNFFFDTSTTNGY